MIQVFKPQLIDSSLYATVVYVMVGPQHKKYGIHQGLLCHVSAYFSGALTGNFKEAQEGVINLEDEDPKIFDRFNSWLYTGSVLSENEELHLSSWAFLIELYIFAEKRMIPTLQDLLMNIMIHLQEIVSSPTTIVTNYWPRFSSTSPLRAFLVSMYTTRVDLTQWLKSRQSGREFDSSESDFIVALTLRYYEITHDKRNISRDLWKSGCHWHVHDQNIPCLSPIV